MTVDALVHGGDERFSGKALGPRDVLISFGFAMVFLLFWKVRYHGREWSAYPWWYDDLYLSIFFVDMFGNAFNLYSLWLEWDHIPHFHGPGALALVLAGAFGLSIVSAVGMAPCCTSFSRSRSSMATSSCIRTTSGTSRTR